MILENFNLVLSKIVRKILFFDLLIVDLLEEIKGYLIRE